MKDSSTPFKILYFFLFLAESKKAQIFLLVFFFIFAESPVLVCQITQHECLQGTCWTATLYAEMWKI